MKRRKFFALIGAATIGYPLAARPQGRGRIQSVGVLWHAANERTFDPQDRCHAQNDDRTPFRQSQIPAVITTPKNCCLLIVT